MTLQKPNTEQAVEGDLAGTMKSVLSRWLMTVDDMLPARVVSYDDGTGFATVQPLVMVGTTGGTKISRAAIANIKTLRLGAGGFFIRFPIKPGDLGWIKANDRDISLILQAGGGEDWPNTKRLHSFSDALFIPDTFKDWVIDGADIDALVIQSLDGSVTVSLRPAELSLKAPEIKVDAPQTTWVGDIDIIGTVTTSGGDVNMTGNIAITGSSLTHNGVNIGSTHTHSGVAPGGGNTGTPNP